MITEHMKGSFKLCLTLLVSCLLIKGTFAQCAGGAYWINGPKPNGTLIDTGIVLGSDTVIARSAGTFASGRPGYGTVSNTWSSYNFIGLHINRGASFASGTYTSYKLKIPLDSNYFHVRVRDIRGDGINTEHQRVEGFLNGTPVAATFKDAINGAFITGGNVINGASTTNSGTQSAMRAFFNSAVDSVKITSTGLSDYVVLEFYSRCDILLPADFLKLTGNADGKNVYLQWETYDERETAGYDVEKSVTGSNWQKIGEQNAKGSRGKNTYDFIDKSPFPGKNLYRIKQFTKGRKISYSPVLALQFSKKNFDDKIEIYPNPFFQHITISYLNPENAIEKIQVFDISGKRIIEQNNTLTAQAISLFLPGLKPGIYYLRLQLKNGKMVSRKLVQQ
ncbi:MAG: T9SS type A sorting domain-containing protein [Chitinophagaceae bacterium]|nr:T9SS type A sorting domain-containing protein [Chitinophagaceae bacterium]